MDQGTADDGRGRGDGAPVALAAVFRLRAAVAEVLEAPVWQLPDGAVRDAVTEGFAALNQSYAAFLRLVLELDSRPGAVEGARPDVPGARAEPRPGAGGC